MSTPAAGSNPDQTRHDIQQTRAELGETVAALAAKTDVKTRARTKATTAVGGLRQRVTQAGQSAKAAATQLTRTLSQKTSRLAKPAAQKAQQASSTVKAGAQTTGKAESTLVTSARTLATKVGTSIRAKPVPVLAATGATAALAAVAYRRRRSR
jgi:hypothetical protein